MASDNRGFVLDEEDQDNDVTEQTSQQELDDPPNHESSFHDADLPNTSSDHDNPLINVTNRDTDEKPSSPNDMWCSRFSPYTYTKWKKESVPSPVPGEDKAFSPLSLDEISQNMMEEIEDTGSQDGEAMVRRERNVRSVQETAESADTVPSDYRAQVFGETALKIIRGNDSATIHYKLFKNDNEEVSKAKPLVYMAAPPVGHFADLNWPEDGARRRRKIRHTFEDEAFYLFDKSTLFGQVSAATGVEDNQRITEEFNKKSAKNGLKILDTLTAVPLSKFWHMLTEGFLILIFFANIAAQIYDIYIGPEYFYYKITALVLSVVENCVVWSLALASKHPKFRDAPDRNKKEKYQQYAENIIHEILLYPLIVIAVVGFVTDKLYEKPGSVYQWILVILLTIDVIDLIWTQALRSIMIYKVFKEIQKVLVPDQKPSVCSRMHGWIFPRAYFSVIGNTFVFAVLLVMVGCQVNKDNIVTSNFRVSFESGILILALITLPLYSLVLFVLANSYWVMEMLISMNLALGQNNSFQETIKQNFGTIVGDFMEYAVGKTDATQDRLKVLSKVSSSKKFFYGLTEIPILILIFLWGCLVVAVFILFSGLSDNGLNYVIKFLFLACVVVTNVHLTVVMLASVLFVVCFLIGALFYPIMLPLCFRKKYAINSDGQFYEI